MKRTYYRGDIYFADLGQGVGSEQHGCRPVVIVQNDTGNRFSPTVIVAAVSSKIEVKAKLPTHCYLGTAIGLDNPSVIMLEQLRTVDKRRLTKYIGRLGTEQILSLNRALAVSVALAEPKQKMELCLCNVCAGNFRDAGIYRLHRVGGSYDKRDVCSYCNTRMGMAYEISDKE